MNKSVLPAVAVLCLVGASFCADRPAYTVTETDKEIRIDMPKLQAAVRKKGYVSGVAAGSLVDKKTGFGDPGYGLDIADWIMEPGSDKAYRDRLDKELIYRYGNAYHGRRAKRSIEGPQICTKARELKPEIVRGKDFVAIRQKYRYRTAAPGKKVGSTWTQLLVFPAGKRYFLSMDRIDAVNDSDAMFLRIDMPGHVKHKNGDTCTKVYLSYHGTIGASEFAKNFAPDEKFNYRRDSVKAVPRRFIRAIQLRDAKTGKKGPWLAGMTLEPSVVHEAWCHQRGYICMILEFGGRPIEAGQSFSAAHIVGYFDSIEEMNKVYDLHKGHTALTVSAKGWKLTK